MYLSIHAMGSVNETRGLKTRPSAHVWGSKSVHEGLSVTGVDGGGEDKGHGGVWNEDRHMEMKRGSGGLTEQLGP